MITLHRSPSDASEFIEQVERLLNGVVALVAPPALHLVQVDGWFDSGWLRFSGKRLGAVPIENSRLTVPPFHPNRVISERHLVRDDESGAYADLPETPALHLKIRSEENLSRHLATVAPGVTCAWYTSESATITRGALMVYVPNATTDGSYWSWYVAYSAGETWRLTRHKGISAAEIAQLETHRHRQTPA
ncbi:MAG TPA: hypothetical protein VJ650_12240 [Gemmatimonadaceae bacterium]|nr:hypothetical protein [Gemmatimonadaceae bacterium]